MTPKELKKLAAACRSAGITHFKNAHVEFTLSDIAPQPSPRKSKKEDKTKTYDEVAKQFETDSLSEDELLFWSTGLNQPTDEQRGN